MNANHGPPAALADYRDAVLGEITQLEKLLVAAAPDELGTTTPCPGWSVLDVARHVVVTPPLIGEAFDASLPPRRTTTPRPLPADAEYGTVLEALRSGAEYVDRALSDGAHADLDLNAPVPGRIGPMPGELALRLTLTELVLHRCDIEMALGRSPAIPDGYAGIVVTTLRDWLFRSARRGLPPASPVGFVLVDEDGRSWGLRYDADGWTEQDDPTPNPTLTPTPTTTVRGPTDRLALALAGRIGFGDAGLTTDDREAAQSLKTYLPGP